MKMSSSAPDLDEEKKIWSWGDKVAVGLDEVGRGAWAGSVVVAAVVLPRDFRVPLGLNDSKKVAPQKRVSLARYIAQNADCYSIAEVGMAVINKSGIGRATQLAFRRAIAHIMTKLVDKSLFLLVDGFHIRYVRGVGLKNQKAIIKGDQKSASIAAASIIAKVHRDQLMTKLHQKFPQYGFDRNMGYGTKSHQMAIRQHGFSLLHRKSFKLDWVLKPEPTSDFR